METTSEADWDAAAASSSSSSSSAATVKVKVPAGGGSSLRRLLNQSKETLIAEEKGLLRQVVQLLEEVAPQVCGAFVQGGGHSWGVWGVWLGQWWGR